MKVVSLFSTGFFLFFTMFFSTFSAAYGQGEDGKFVVVLDAGHGGHDPGNLGNGYLEKNIALGIVLAAGKALESDSDIEVVFTRKDDRFVDLYVRGEIANKAKADLFVSVHCDSHNSDANGAGTFVLGLHANKQNFEIAKKENSVIYLEDNYETRYAAYDINSPESIIGLTIMQEEFLEQSILLGKMMQDNFTKSLKRKDRKVKQAGFIVLHQTFMPSVLIETGFLTNKSEGAYLNSSKGQTEMGKAIADAIILYKNNLWSQPNLIAEGGEAVITSVPKVIPQAKEEPAEEIAETAQNEVQPAVEEFETTEENPGITEGASSEDLVMTDPGNESGETSVSSPSTDQNEDQNISVAEEADMPEEESVTETVQEMTEELKQEAVKEQDNVETAVASIPEKTEPPKPEVAVEQPKTETKSADKPISFKVQILASSKEIPLRAENFNGLSTISREPYKNLYRYMYGETSSYDQAKLLKSNADLKGYSTSFIVAYRKGERIPLQEALKSISE